jgi:hypothetical protein
MNEDPACLATAPSSVLSRPHSAAFLDLYGDCMPDLFLTTETFDVQGNSTGFRYEIYSQVLLANGTQRYCLVQTDAFAGEPPLVAFADMDRDGMTDMVYYADRAIYTLYNKRRANPASDDSLCVKPGA